MASAKPQAYTVGSNPVLKFEGAFHVTKLPIPPSRAIQFYVKTYSHHPRLKAMEASGKKPVSTDSSSRARSISSNTYIQPQPCLFPLPKKKKRKRKERVLIYWRCLCPQPTHFHIRQHEYFHVAKGSLTVEINGVAHKFTAKDGGYALPPRYDLIHPCPLLAEAFSQSQLQRNFRIIP